MASTDATVVREIAVDATLTLSDDPHFGRLCGDGYAVVSRAGVLTVLDGGLRVVRTHDLGGPVADLSVTPDGLWAWVAREQLWVGDPGVAGGVSAPLSGETACRWALSGQALWVASGTGDEVLVELRTRSGEVVRSVTVPDEFGDSMMRLRHYPDASGIVLWLAAGQDGQQSWLVHDDGTATRLPADDCLPAMFGPDCDWLLAAGDDGLAMVSWPSGASLGELAWADIDPEAAEDGTDEPGGCLMSLPDGFVSWSSESGRLRTIDLSTMTVVDEIALAGHPVRTVAERYPNLPDDLNLCGDFDYAVPGARNVMSVHGRTLVLSSLLAWSPSREG